jgi:Ca2+-binding EF-hand superfamily protein
MRVMLHFFKKYNNTNSVDDFLTKRQFMEYAASLGINLFLQEQLFRVFDGDNDNLLDFRDFMIGLAVFMGGSYKEKLKSMILKT